MEIVLELHIVIRGKMEDWNKLEAIKDRIVKAVEWPGIEAEVGGGLFKEDKGNVQKELTPM
jgi:hypothetical protein